MYYFLCPKSLLVDYMFSLGRERLISRQIYEDTFENKHGIQGAEHLQYLWLFTHFYMVHWLMCRCVSICT